MEFKKSLTVPFQVVSPLSGIDITRSVRLTAIETEGAPAPFFQLNGDDTFKVINAERNDVTADTTFKFSIEDQGISYNLEAKTSVTVKAYDGPLLDFNITVPVDGFIAISQTVGQKTFDYVPTYRGKPLGVDVALLDTVTSTDPNDFTYWCTIHKEELLPDGITHRVTFSLKNNLVYAQSGASNLKLIRQDATAPAGVEGDTVLTKAYQMSFNPNGTNVVYFMTSEDRYPRGRNNEKLRSYIKIMYNDYIIPLNDSSVSIDIFNRTDISPNMGGYGRYIVKDGPATADYFPLAITSSVPGSNGTDYRFQWRIKRGSTEIFDGPANVTVLAGKVPRFEVDMTGPVVADTEDAAVFTLVTPPESDLGYVPEWSANPGSVFSTGQLAVWDMEKNVRLTEFDTDVTGLKSDQIARFIKEISTSYMKQEVRLINSKVVVRRKPGDPGFKEIAVNTGVMAIPANPVWVETVVTDISADNTAKVQIPITLYQMRGGVKTAVAATLSDVTVSGPASYDSIGSNSETSNYAVIVPTGAEGVVRIKGTLTGVDSKLATPFDIAVNAGAYVIVVEDVPMSVSVFDEGNTFPFKLTKDGVDITSEITDVKVINNAYVQKPELTDSIWEIYNNVNAITNSVTQFIYTYVIDGVPRTLTARGTFTIAPWNGITLSIIMPVNDIGVSTEADRTFTVLPTYRGKPAADKVGLNGLGNMAEWLTIVSQTHSDDNKVLTITVRGKKAQVGPNKGGAAIVGSGLEFSVNGKPGLTENVDLVTRNGTQFFIHGDYLTMFNQPWCITGKQGSVDYLRIQQGRYRASIYMFANGERIDLNDQNLDVYSVTGSDGSDYNGTVAWSFAGGNGTTMYGRLTGASAGGKLNHHNPIQAKWTSREGKNYTYLPTGTDGNFWVYGESGSVEEYQGVDLTGVVTAVSDNHVEFGLANGGTKLQNPTVQSWEVVTEPVPGNALLDENKLKLGKVQDKTDTIFADFPAGYTGDAMSINMVVTDPSFSGYRQGSIRVPIPKATVDVVIANNEIDGTDMKRTDITFTLSQTRLDGEKFLFPASAINGAKVDSGPATIVGGYSNDGEGNFGMSVAGTGEDGAIRISFTLRDGTVDYPVYLDLVAKVPAKLPLTLTDGFITSIEGDYRNTVTVKQSTILPTE